MHDPSEFAVYDAHRQKEVQRWKAEKSATGELVHCPLDTEGFWLQSHCSSRLTLLRHAAGSGTVEAKQAKQRLKRCLQCWESFSV